MNNDEATADLFRDEMNFLRKFETADDLANHFRAEGIKAVRGSVHSCAISEHLMQSTGAVEVRTGAYRATMYASRTGIAISMQDLSAAMSEFVAQFDRNFYPDLVEL